ncbi:MAG: LysR family transcriptional regulator [Ruminococcaceae bacterium]|nr:LysR family transcriptional regulator [Oscillospiraceae bacterium]
MEILQLRYFFMSAKNENFSTTAKLYGVPTTAVSSSVRRLEEELGCKLFDRTHNRIILNAKGRRLQQALCTVFAELDKAIEDVSKAYEDKREIKVLVRGMRREVTDLLSKFSRMHPDVAFRIAFNGDDEYDVIVDDGKEIYADYRKFELYSLRLHLRCSAGDPLCQQQLSLSDLCDRAFVSMDQESNMHRILTNACIRKGFRPKIAAFCNDIECYDKLVAMGMGIGIGRENRLPSTGSDGTEIANLKVLDFNEHYTVYVYYRERDYFGNVKKLIDFMKEK